MKIKDGFMLSRVAGSYVVVPVGAVQADFTGMITLNPVGAFLWGKLEKETTRDELLKSVLSRYDTDEKTAAQDIDRYLEKAPQKRTFRGMIFWTAKKELN